MPTEIKETGIYDFGMGLMAGLVLANWRTLDERRLKDVHESVVEAFRVVEAELGKDTLGFWMTTHRIYGTSHDVDGIFQYWLSSGYSTKDAPGTIYRFDMSKDEATRLLETLPGGAELYAKAVAAMLEHLRTNHYS